MKTDQNNTKILLISKDVIDIKAIDFYLQNNLHFPCSLWHYATIEDAEPRICNAKVIILDLALGEITAQIEAFKHVQDMATETPVIVIVSQQNHHDLSQYVMESGAADTVLRGSYRKLLDTIEFALIRKKIADSISYKNENDQKNRKISRNIQAIKDKKISDDKDQCISWLSGCYSLENIIKTNVERERV